MMKPFICGVLASLALVAPAANAQTFSALPNTTQSIDLDTQGGLLSVWQLKDLQGADALRIKFAVRRLGTDAKWAPAFNFELGTGENAVRVQLRSTGRGKPLLAFLSGKAGGTSTDEMFLAGLLNVDDEAELAIDWKTSGEVEFILTSPATKAVNGGGERHKFALGAAPTTAKISASTGELEVSSLQLGRLSR